MVRIVQKLHLIKFNDIILLNPNLTISYVTTTYLELNRSKEISAKAVSFLRSG